MNPPQALSLRCRSFTSASEGSLNRRAFSLVELLAVVSICGLLAAIAVPRMQGVIAANQLTAAGDKVASLIATARSEAMSQNTMTALVILTNQGTESDGRAITVLRYDRDQGWMQTTPWALLPKGVAVDLSNPTACTFLLNSPAPFPFLQPGQDSPPVKFQKTQVKTSEGYAARLFLPGGGLSNGDTPATIRLVEGIVNNGSVVNTGNTENYYDVTIIGETGLTRIARP